MTPHIAIERFCTMFVAALAGCVLMHSNSEEAVWSAGDVAYAPAESLDAWNRTDSAKGRVDIGPSSLTTRTEVTEVGNSDIRSPPTLQNAVTPPTRESDTTSVPLKAPPTTEVSIHSKKNENRKKLLSRYSGGARISKPDKSRRFADDEQRDTDGSEDTSNRRFPIHTAGANARPVPVTPLESSGTSDPEEQIIESLKTLRKSVGDIVEKVLRQALPTMMSMGSEVKLSQKCMFTFLKWMRGIRQFEQWAIRMIDASSKIPEGVLHGTFSTFGAYDECVEIEVPDLKAEPDDRIRGQYCSVEIKPFLPPKSRHYTLQTAFQEYPELRKTLKDLKIDEETMAFYYFLKHRLGLCLPSVCSKEDLDGIAKQITLRFKTNITVERCEMKQGLVMDRSQIIASFGILFFVMLVVIGTAVDIVPQMLGSIFRNTYLQEKFRQKVVVKHVCETFSAYSNAMRILNTSSPNGHLRALHGIRFLSLTWVMLGHIYYCKDYVAVAALSKVRDLGSNFTFQVVLNAAFAGDTFFLLSGLLVVYVTLRRMDERNGRFNLFGFYFHRYWRLTPAFMLATGLILLGPTNGSGPVWHETLEPFVDGCRKNWWTNLLYISNFVHTKESCVPHGWYVSCDMQFYIFSPVIFLALYRRPFVGKLFLIAGIIISMVTVGALTFLLDQPPVSLFSLPDPGEVNEYLDTIAYKPYTHFAPYCVGMATGYLLYTQRKLNFKPISLAFGWCLAVITCVAVVYGTLDWNKGNLPGWAAAVAYASTARTVWASGVAWVTIVCISGHGGFVNTLLSWKGFVPLSRLTYLAYLLHPLLMYLYSSFVRAPFYFNQYFVMYLYLGHICATFGLAFGYALVFESPFIAIERILVRSLERRRKGTSKSADLPTADNEMKEAVTVKSVNVM